MTAKTEAKTGMKRLTPLTFIPLVLGGLLLVAYYLLPFVTQPELGATTVTTLLASRSNNEVGIVTGGLTLFPIVGLGALILFLWGAVQPQVDRVVAFLLMCAGIVGLAYFVIFFQDYRAEEATFLNEMGVAFWAMLVLCGLMVLQIVIPRRILDKRYELRRVLGNQESIIFIGLLLLTIFVGISNPRFLAERNLSDVMQSNAYIAIAALGMSMVIITGNIDISVGSMIGLLAVVSGRIAVDNYETLGEFAVILAWISPLVLGVILQGAIGVVVAYLRIPSIVVTLGMLSVFKGVLIMWVQGERVTDLPATFYLAQQRPLGIPVPILFMVLLTIGAAIWMRYSALGRYFYAIGGNKEAAHLSGISEQRVTVQVFMMNGFFAGVAALLYATQFQLIQATPPPALELSIITASVVGGVSILGGTGTVVGSTLAAILLNAIRSAMVFISVSPFWIQAVQGVLILLTVLADLIRRRRQRM
ncbi:MAG: ABC transporter permease [Aggregatilineales bacterium]